MFASRLFILSIILGPGLAYGGVYLYHVIATALLPTLFVKKIHNKIYIISAIFIVLGSLALLIGGSNSEGLTHYILLLNFVYGTVLFISLNKRQKISIYFIQSLILAFLLNMCLGLLEVFTDFSLPISEVSREINVIFQNDENNIDLLKFLGSTPTGFWANPNNFALVCLLSIPIFSLINNHWARYIIILCAIFLIYMASARAAMLGVYLWLFLRSFSMMLRLKLSTILVIPFLISCIIVLNSSSIGIFPGKEQAIAIPDLSNSIDFSVSNSFSDRISNSILMLEVLFLNPLFGVGLGKTSTFIGGAALHNWWLELLVEFGLFSFLIFVIIFFKILFSLRRIYLDPQEQQDIRRFSRALFESFLIAVPGVLGISSGWYFLPFIVLIGSSICIISSYSSEAGRQ